ncbi:hypothetical protein HCUR_00682 [Holospora curviuscula]|uniref:Uncharacterized protein n=2 Tax=Holospora curviuscula TaxID=1082868 RepID=A0A2S5R9M9_9PROT|nr:hypothetical protein HCUR_00682 [Holospora curviuscula]
MIFRMNVWSFLAPHLPRREGLYSNLTKENQNFINMVFGVCEQSLGCVMVRPIIANRATLIANLFAGETRKSGKNCLQNALFILIKVHLQTEKSEK